MNEPDDASDYIATIEADLGHDATDALSRIAATTLVIAGSRDLPSTPTRSFARPPNGSLAATLRLYDGVGHGSARPISAGSRTTYWASCAVDSDDRSGPTQVMAFRA